MLIRRLEHVVTAFNRGRENVVGTIATARSFATVSLRKEGCVRHIDTLAVTVVNGPTLTRIDQHGPQARGMYIVKIIREIIIRKFQLKIDIVILVITKIFWRRVKVTTPAKPIESERLRGVRSRSSQGRRWLAESAECTLGKTGAFHGPSKHLRRQAWSTAKATSAVVARHGRTCRCARLRSSSSLLGCAVSID